MRIGGNTFYLLNDHPSTMLRTSLTSTAITANSSGVRQTELRYFAYGGTRYDAGGQLTAYRLQPLRRLPTLHLEASTRCEILPMTACNMSVALTI